MGYSPLRGKFVQSSADCEEGEKHFGASTNLAM